MSGFVVWLTGLSGAGKSTIARRLQEELAALGRPAEILDGDEVRTHLSAGLGFSKEDRDTNIRRIGYVARVLARNGGVAITAAISPYREVRDELRSLTPGFFEVYVRCPLEELLRRDVKGLYAKALRGEIANFTGVSDPYEEPLNPELTVDTETESPETSVDRVLAALARRGHVHLAPAGCALAGEELADARARAASLPAIEVSGRDHTDAYMLTTGALAPLRGFMDARDYHSVVEAGRLADGAPFTIPVVLRVDGLVTAEEVALTREGRPVALLRVSEVFQTDPDAEATQVYGTAEGAHPGVALLHAAGRTAVAGEARLLSRPQTAFPEHDLTPAAIRAERARRGWSTMVGFQTRNPVHRAHEYLQKVALESIDGLLLHPLVGETKPGDIPSDVRMRCYQALLANYFPADRVLLATNPAWMRYAGPREAVFHAIVRRNFGCTHFIVGRDHAGVGSYYGTYDAQLFFDRYQPGELGIEILRFENTFYCTACGSMASTRTCPHPADARLSLSGTRVRELLARGDGLPAEFTRPEIAEILSDVGARRASPSSGRLV
jgi:sulfate adenylyltransferase/3'-phosphoadenosine 5'-phosphosulfate synthase